MAIQSIIIHRLTKTSPSHAAQLGLRDEPLPLNGKTEELCREVKNTYLRKAGKVYGCFSDESAEAPLKPLLMELLNDKISFHSFSKQVMQQLKSRFDSLEQALDQHVLLYFERLEAGDALYIALLDHANGHQVDGGLDLCDARYLDTQSLNLAAKIKITELLENQQQNYLSVSRWRGEKDLSDAFLEALGFANKVDVAADTSQFLDLVTTYTQELPESEAKETRTQVVDYCLEQDKSGQEISVTELSQQLPSTANSAFVDYVSAMQPQMTKPFVTDKTQLRNYVRISGRNEQMSMSFASACLGNSVVYDAEQDSIIIRDIPPGLKTKLLQHLKKWQAAEESS